MLVGHFTAVLGVFDQQHIVDHAAQGAVELLRGSTVHAAAVTQQEDVVH